MSWLALPERILRRISPEPTSGCWLWSGKVVTGTGYGGLSWRGRDALAHRHVYTLLRGPIPAGLVIDHLCRVRSCVNPDHMEPVTTRENVTIRAIGSPTSINYAKTACVRCGGEFRVVTRLRRAGLSRTRFCRRCNTRWCREWRAANRDHVNALKRAWRAANPDKTRAQRQRQDRDHVNALKRARRARMKAAKLAPQGGRP